MILFYTCVTLYLFNGPLKPTDTTIADPNCVDYWWTNILYVNNIVEPIKAVSYVFDFYLNVVFS